MSWLGACRILGSPQGLWPLPPPPPPAPCAKLTLCFTRIRLYTYNTYVLHTYSRLASANELRLVIMCPVKCKIINVFTAYNCLPLQMSRGHNMSCNVLPRFPLSPTSTCSGGCNVLVANLAGNALEYYELFLRTIKIHSCP